MKSIRIVACMILIALAIGAGLLINKKTGSTINAIPMGQKIIIKDLPPLPAGCMKVSDSCWMDGAKIIETGTGPVAVHKK